MSVTTSPPAFADPLADDVLTSPAFTPASPPAVPGERPHKGSLNRDRAALLAPDVEGQPGSDAIALVRASGLIAAVETAPIAEDAQQGVVVEQDPPPGTQMVREGVLTLSIGQAAPDAKNAGHDDPAAQSDAESSTAAHDENEDDTEQWFATLGPPLDNSPVKPDASAPRRRRKHRPPPVPGADASAPLEVPPDPLLPPRDPALEQHSDRSLQPTARHPLANAREAVSPQPTASYTLSDRHSGPGLKLAARYRLANAREAVPPQPTIGDPPPDGQADLSTQSAAYDQPPQERSDLSQQPTARHPLPDWQEPVSPQDTIGEPRPDRQGDHSPEPAAHQYFTSLLAAVLVRLPDGSVKPTWRRRALIFGAAIVVLLVFTRVGASRSHQPPFPPPSTARPRVVASPGSAHLRDWRSAGRIPRPVSSWRSAVRPRRPRSAPTPQPVVATASVAGPVPGTSAPSNPPSEPPPGPFIYLGK